MINSLLSYLLIISIKYLLTIIFLFSLTIMPYYLFIERKKRILFQVYVNLMIVSSAIRYLEKKSKFIRNIFETVSNFETDENLAFICLIISFISFGVGLIENVLYSLNSNLHLQLDWYNTKNTKLKEKSVVNCLYPANTIDNSMFNYKLIDKLTISNENLLMETYEWISNNIVETSLSIYDLPSDSLIWINKMIEYNIMGGTFGRGLACISVRELISDKILNESIQNEDRIKASACGLAIEFLHNFFLILDDIEDNNQSRRGKKCYYKTKNVGMIAINDSLLLENSVYKILKRYIGNECYYLQVLDLYIEASRRTALGQYLDLTTVLVDTNDPIDTDDTTISNKSLNVNRYTSIIKNKISYYSYYLPIAVSMILSGINDSRMFIFIEKLLLDMGEFYQIENDFLDYYRYLFHISNYI